jgi:hypothetical protein
LKARTIAFLATVVLILASSTLSAATYVVPTDAAMVSRSHAIVVAHAVDSYAVDTPGRGIETITHFTVEEAIKGSAIVGSEFDVHEPGGHLGDRFKVIFGAPHFTAGDRVLLFLYQRSDGGLTTTDLALGHFHFATDVNGHHLVVRSEGDVTGWDIDGSTHVEKRRDAARFLGFLRGVVKAPESVSADYYVATHPLMTQSSSLHTAANFASHGSTSYTLASTDETSLGFRWTEFPGAVSWNQGNTLPSAPGGGTNAIHTAFNAWNGDGGSNVNYQLSSSTPNTNGIEVNPDNVNNIVFERDLGQGAYNCSVGGLLGQGGIQTGSFLSSNNAPDGENFIKTVEGDVSMNIGLNACGPSGSLFTSGDFDTALTHEIGHTLGFRHSDQNRVNPAADCSTDPLLECSNVAVMKASIVHGIGGGLQQWDVNAVQAVYGSGVAVCNPPSINTQPQAQPSTITQGQSSTLSVLASGTSVSYQWFTGTPGTMTSGVIGTAASISVSPTTTTSYWVRVTSGCGANPSVNSLGVTVTVNPAVCNAPAITSQPVDRTITQGQGTALAVSATGTNLTYQWFTGTTGTTSGGVIGTGPTITVSPSSTTSFWVRVTSACGANPAVNSNTVTVTVNAAVCIAPAFLFDPSNQQILAGQTATLSVGVQGTSPTITWYRGFKSDMSTPVGTGNNFTTPPLTVTTTYWAQVTNACGHADSNNATVTVGACTAPAITSATASPSSVTPTANTSTLSVVATGTSPTFQWFVGQPLNTTSPVPGGTGSSVVVNPTVTTTYWVRVTSGCGAGAVNSGPVTVTVGTCAPPTITTQPADAAAGGSTATNLTVVAAGTAPLHYQWFRGTSTTDRTHPVGGDSPVLTVPPISSKTSFFVVITNGCGNIASRVSAVSLVRRHAARH